MYRLIVRLVVGYAIGNIVTRLLLAMVPGGSHLSSSIQATALIAGGALSAFLA